MADIVEFRAKARPKVEYEPPDAVIERFHASQALVRAVKGPRGSGKSGASIMEGFQGAGIQEPNHEGKRRTRFLVLRDTYRQLETTTIPSFKKWLGHATRFTGQYPIKGYTKVPMNDGTLVDMETVFLAMDGENIMDNLQSFEASFAWVNEARAIADPKVVNMVISSCGRFPSKDEEGCTSRFVVMDSNPSDEQHWWYKRAQPGQTPEGWEFFDQVSPLIYKSDAPIFHPIRDLYIPNPAATYAHIQNAGYNYWLDLVPGADDPFIRTMVMGEYGVMVMGKPVYQNFWHEDCLSLVPLEWHQALPIVIGIDTSGLHPGAAFMQAWGGRINLLRELHAKDTPFDVFVESVLLPFIAQWFRMNPLLAVLDPSNPRSGVGGKTALKVMNDAGISAVLAPGQNRFNTRIGAVSKLLQRRGAFMVDPSCTMSLAGFRGKYHYKKVESSSMEVYKPMPEKDEYADVHDAIQYGCLYYQTGANSDKSPVPQVRRRMV
jgi:hypothetical protein